MAGSAKSPNGNGVSTLALVHLNIGSNSKTALPSAYVPLPPTAGEDGVAAPRLRDAGLPLPRLRAAYTEMLLVLRNLYQKCRLVHADLSEYNILYHKVEVEIGGPSQAT